MSQAPSYQRAVTPTMDTASSGNTNSLARGKLLSYQQSQLRKNAASGNRFTGALSSGATSGASATQQQQMMMMQQQQQIQQQSTSIQGSSSGVQSANGARGQNGNMLGDMMNIQGRSTASGRAGVNTAGVGGQNSGATLTNPLVPSVKYGADTHQSVGTVQGASNPFPRSDLIPLADEIPADGIVFAKMRSNPSMLVVFRTPEERLRNPERLNLDRRHLESIPMLEMELRLRLLNFQNNGIRAIQNLENLPNLIFLDLYNNKLTSLEGSVSSVKGLRVLMAGKNRITAISNLSQLRKLDVLDLHSNDIHEITGLSGLTDLRVLNLAGNKIKMVANLSSLQSLTELNLRRNAIESVNELDKLPTLQRVFLSHNKIARFLDIQCMFQVKFLIELSLDGNPVAEADAASYRTKVIGGMPGLRHLDLQRISEEDRAAATQAEALRREMESAEAGEGFNGGEAGEGGAEDGEGNARGGAQQHADWPEGSVLGGMHHFNKPGDSEGLASLARSGRVSAAQSLFDLELIGPNEKALVAVGDAWEWVQAKRLLVGVTEASLYHMKRDVITSKFSCNISWLPALSCLRLVNNELTSFKDIDILLESFGPQLNLDHLTIRDNPISASQTLLRAYVIVLLPNLKSFNDLEISPIERADSLRTLKPIIQIRDLALLQRASLSVVAGGGGASVSRNSFASGMPLVRSSKTATAQGKSRAGSKAAVALSSSDETAIEKACVDLCADALTKRRSSDSFEEDFRAEIKAIFIDTVRELREGAR